MNTPLAFLKCTMAAALLLGNPALLNSQNADDAETASAKPMIIDVSTITTVAGPLGPKTAQERLEALRAINAELLKRQQVTLERLHQLEIEANQLRIFAKRG